jgi:hypothetical protein
VEERHTRRNPENAETPKTICPEELLASENQNMEAIKKIQHQNFHTMLNVSNWL